MDVPLGTTAVELDSRNATVRTREAAIGNLIADAMRDATQRRRRDHERRRHPRRQGLSGRAPRITRRDVLAELPFSNRVVTVEIDGADLRRAIENGLSQLPERRRPLPAGVGHDRRGRPRRAPPGSRVVSIRVGDAPLDDERTYRVATNDFLARGGDGYDMFADASRLLPDPDAPLLANEVMTYVRKLGTVKTGVERRIVLK